MMDKQPDILLIDQSLQDKPGLEFCEKVHQTGLARKSHTIYMSDFADATELDSALSSGVKDFVIKPFNLVELSARLKIASDKITSEEQLQSQAMTDPLTGLANRRNFYKQLDAERDRTIRYRHMVSYVTFDVDYFKTINDEYGHQTGDHLLMQIAAILKNNSRKSDIVCRQGGDEFCALLPQTIEKDAAIWVEKIRTKVAELVVDSKQGQKSVSLSAGIVQIDQNSLSLAKMLDCADEALRVAKSLGRNRVI
jgi:diguanylate cyclase (GGDEF)-like protein